MYIHVITSDGRESVMNLWWQCFHKHWPDCQWSVMVTHILDQVGFSKTIHESIRHSPYERTLFMLDDNWIPPGEHTARMNHAMRFMDEHPDAALLKLQIGGAWPPDIPCPEPWSFIGEYDRQPSDHKRTNIVPSIIRVGWLRHLTAEIAKTCGAERDKKYNGVCEFEYLGTQLTADAKLWPEKMYGIRRDIDVPGFIACPCNDGVHRGKFIPKALEELRGYGIDVDAVPGIEALL